ncbi:MAG: serine/threonine-protein kinase, partial [Planctomycetota bacterium]|nr:serine/threonine-protein kinase [Planctomycetota bacterium]
MHTELSLHGQTWIMDDGQQVDTREIFARLLAEQMGNKRSLINTRIRAKESTEARPVESIFRLIGHYGVLGALGEGAFGQVYLGFDARKRNDGRTGRLVAIKMPNDSLIDRYAKQQVNLEADTLGMDTSNATELRRWARMSIGQLFAKEATLTARLAMCPHVVKVLDQDVMAPYIVLEFCNGGSLANRLREPFEIKHVINWGIQIATALDAAHSLEPDHLVHRDLKPDNILIMGDVLKITDFGTSKLVEATESLRSLQGGYTPLYGAPEAFDGKAQCHALAESASLFCSLTK